MFKHAVKHSVTHALWMLPMAMVMMPSPALASGLVGSFDMMLTNGFNFFAEGGFSTLVENTLEGNFWDEGYSLFDGSMSMDGHDMAEHAVGDVLSHGGHNIQIADAGDVHDHAPLASKPDLGASALEMLGVR